jgi:hypothetical protein
MWISPCLSAARQDDQAAQVERIWAEHGRRGASAQLLRWLPFEKRWRVRENGYHCFERSLISWLLLNFEVFDRWEYTMSLHLSRPLSLKKISVFQSSSL